MPLLKTKAIALWAAFSAAGGGVVMSGLAEQETQYENGFCEVTRNPDHSVNIHVVTNTPLLSRDLRLMPNKNEEGGWNGKSGHLNWHVAPNGDCSFYPAGTFNRWGGSHYFRGHFTDEPTPDLR